MYCTDSGRFQLGTSIFSNSTSSELAISIWLKREIYFDYFPSSFKYSFDYRQNCDSRNQNVLDGFELEAVQHQRKYESYSRHVINNAQNINWYIRSIVKSCQFIEFRIETNLEGNFKINSIPVFAGQIYKIPLLNKITLSSYRPTIVFSYQAVDCDGPVVNPETLRRIHIIPIITTIVHSGRIAWDGHYPRTTNDDFLLLFRLKNLKEYDVVSFEPCSLLLNLNSLGMDFTSSINDTFGFVKPIGCYSRGFEIRRKNPLVGLIASSSSQSLEVFKASPFSSVQIRANSSNCYVQVIITGTEYQTYDVYLTPKVVVKRYKDSMFYSATDEITIAIPLIQVDSPQKLAYKQVCNVTKLKSFPSGIHTTDNRDVIFTFSNTYNISLEYRFKECVNICDGKNYSNINAGECPGNNFVILCPYPVQLIYFKIDNPKIRNPTILVSSSPKSMKIRDSYPSYKFVTSSELCKLKFLKNDCHDDAPYYLDRLLCDREFVLHINALPCEIVYKQECEQYSDDDICLEEVKLTPLLGEWRTYSFYHSSRYELKTRRWIIAANSSTNYETEVKFLYLNQLFVKPFSDPGLIFTVGSLISDDVSDDEEYYFEPKNSEIAALGKSFLYDSVKIQIRKKSSFKFPSKSTKYFEIVYRQVTKFTADEISSLNLVGEKLVAQNQWQSFNLPIPKRYSSEVYSRRIEKVKQGFSDGLDVFIPFYSLNNRWTIQANNSNCHVLVQFIKMDIGPGYLPYQNGWPGFELEIPMYRVNQQRLSIIRSSDTSELSSKTKCDQASIGFNTLLNPCARVGPIFSSIHASLTISFNSFLEATFGSGTTLKYRQECEVSLLPDKFGNSETILQAVDSWTKISQIPKNPPHYYFHSWAIQPSNPRSCFVMYKLTPEMPYTIEDETYKLCKDPFCVQNPFDNQNSFRMGGVPYVKFVLYEIPKQIQKKYQFSYRQDCSSTLSPSALATLVPTKSPTISRFSLLGETCEKNLDCQNQFCSVNLGICGDLLCQQKCSQLNVNVCVIFSQLGCVCTWNGYNCISGL